MLYNKNNPYHATWENLKNSKTLHANNKMQIQHANNKMQLQNIKTEMIFDVISQRSINLHGCISDKSKFCNQFLNLGIRKI